jgi:hypothetical protein
VAGTPRQGLVTLILVQTGSESLVTLAQAEL